jgi:hypothetical protein
METQISLGSIEYGVVKEKYFEEFNENLVRSAEERIFFSSKEKWIELLVKKNSDWRTESLNDELPFDNGRFLISRDRPRKKTN